MKHCGASRGLNDPWFAEHSYTTRLHCGQWLRIYLGGWAELIYPPEDDPPPRAASAWCRSYALNRPTLGGMDSVVSDDAATLKALLWEAAAVDAAILGVGVLLGIVVMRWLR